MGRHRMSNIGACGVFDMAGRWCSAVFVVGGGMDMVARLARSRPSQARCSRENAGARGQQAARLAGTSRVCHFTLSYHNGLLPHSKHLFLFDGRYVAPPRSRRILSSHRTRRDSLNIHSRVVPEARPSIDISLRKLIHRAFIMLLVVLQGTSSESWILQQPNRSAPAHMS